MNVTFLDCTDELNRVIAQRELSVPEFMTINRGDPSAREMAALCQDADVILVEHTVLPPHVLQESPRTKAIIFMGTGAGTYVDLEDAERRGITVLTIPGYGDRAVAEHAMALMFAAARNTGLMDREMRIGIWRPVGGLQLQGRKLAVIGLGGIGRSLAGLAQALGMDVTGWNRSPRNEPYFEPDLRRALQNADVISLHLSLTAETKGLLTRELLELPKRGFILVNTARADLIEEHVLLECVTSGRIGHAAMDVFHQEPLSAEHPFLSLDSVTLTAHAAYMTDDAYAELWRRTLLAIETLRADLA